MSYTIVIQANLVNTNTHRFFFFLLILKVVRILHTLKILYIPCNENTCVFIHCMHADVNFVSYDRTVRNIDEHKEYLLVKFFSRTSHIYSTSEEINENSRSQLDLVLRIRTQVITATPISQFY